MRPTNAFANRSVVSSFNFAFHPSHQYIVPASQRWQSTTNAPNNSQKPATASLSPRWLSDVKQRVGKCITFGLQPDQTAEAGEILAVVAKDWRELAAGSEGFLTGPDRRGMHRQEVVWGEMDSMVRPPLVSI